MMAIRFPITKLLNLFCLFLGCKNSNATLEPIAAFITLFEKVSPSRIITVIKIPASNDWIIWYFVMNPFFIFFILTINKK